MRSRVLRRLSPHLKRAYLKIGLGKIGSRQEKSKMDRKWDPTRGTTESRFSELLKKVIRIGEAKFKNELVKSSRNISYSDSLEILDAQLDVPVNETIDRVFDEISGSGDKSVDTLNDILSLTTPMPFTKLTAMFTTPSTISSTTPSTTPITKSKTGLRRKPWIKRRRITYRPAFKGLMISHDLCDNVNFRCRNHKNWDLN